MYLISQQILVLEREKPLSTGENKTYCMIKIILGIFGPKMLLTVANNFSFQILFGKAEEPP
jgi:hypothetical protein